MLNFIIKRYLLALNKRRVWLWAALIPFVIFLAGAALYPDHFLVYQDITLSAGSPISNPTSPVAVIPMETILSNPQQFFNDKYARHELQRTLTPTAAASQALS